MSELMVALEFVWVYKVKGSLDDHLSKTRQVFIRLRHAGLKVNAAKCSFGATETEYLGYVLTRDGIKPQPKKVKAVLHWHHHRMSNNYIDSWAWSSTTETSGQDEAKCCHPSLT